MRLYKLTLPWALAIAVVACATFETPKTPQESINQANILITSTAQQVTENVKVGLMTTPERDQVVAELKKYSTIVDDAQVLLRNGNATEAQQRLQFINAALLELNKRVAAKARKQ